MILNMLSLNSSTDPKGSSPAERLAALRALPAADLVELYPRRIGIGPSGDGKLLPRSWTHKGAHPTTRCKSLIIGDSKVEAIILNPLIRATDPVAFRERVHRSLPAPAADEFLETFGFKEGIQGEEFYDAYREFLSILMFQFPSMAVAKTYPGDTFYYHQDEPSPYEGITKGHAAHALCSMFLFLNGCDSYPERTRQVSEYLAKSWTAFAHGVDPWPSFNKAQQFMRLGPEGSMKLTDFKSDDSRSYGYVDWLDANCEIVIPFCRSIFSEDWGR